ncbi:MAG: hypothetical protein WKG07_30000 [Hymenobacter sp.]
MANGSGCCCASSRRPVSWVAAGVGVGPGSARGQAALGPAGVGVSSGAEGHGV